MSVVDIMLLGFETGTLVVGMMATDCYTGCSAW
jgi:hypothetical protein